MPYTVTISFGQNNDHEFKFADAEVQALSRDDANHWLRGEFDALDCAPRNPMGKILLLDIVLDIAKFSGETRFIANRDWAKRFAMNCAAALGRENVRIDIPNFVIG